MLRTKFRPRLVGRRRRRPRLLTRRFTQQLGAVYVIGCIGAFGLVQFDVADQLLATTQSVALTPSTSSGQLVARQFSICSGPLRANCVVDGDTVWLSGTKIRIADFDAPEVFSPSCASEAALGARATLRLQALMNTGAFEVENYGARKTDRYGRQLRILTRNGVSLGAMLVAEGLGHPWRGRRESWC